MSSNGGLRSLTAERLRELANYDPATGIFTCRSQRSNTPAGAPMGTPDAHGYLKCKIDTHCHKVHRLAWLYMTGCHPVAQIDHINGDRSDNRFSNLRQATVRQNGHNRKEHRAGAHPGVYQGKAKGTWGARIKVGGKYKHLGTFTSRDDARLEVRRAADALNRSEIATPRAEQENG